jgi:hypothetical protein
VIRQTIHEEKVKVQRIILIQCIILNSHNANHRSVMTCKGICIRHKAQKPLDHSGRYAAGQKRCQICAIYMRWDGMWCPCCGCRVRTRSHNSKFKQKLKTTRKKRVTDNSSTLFVN